MKYFCIFLLCTFILSFQYTYAEETNAGFVQGLWYSSEPVFDHVPTRIYVALRNNTPHDLTGTIRFADNGKRIGSSPVSALSGRLVEAWVDWVPTAGSHTLSVDLSDAVLHVIGEGTRPADIAGITIEDTLIVDYDTDKDGVGNETDTDDDNDGVADVDEKTRGSDPLVPNPKPNVETSDNVPDEVTQQDEPDSIPEPATPSEEGFEKYLEDGIADTLLENVTEKVVGAKQSLDTYRTERNEQIYDNTSEVDTTSEEIPIGTYTDNATITRTKIETKNTFLSSFVSGISTILKNIWTFVLWTLSKVLTHPAVIQFILLLSILYILYRMVRRVGRRPIG